MFHLWARISFYKAERGLIPPRIAAPLPQAAAPSPQSRPPPPVCSPDFSGLLKLPHELFIFDQSLLSSTHTQEVRSREPCLVLCLVVCLVMAPICFSHPLVSLGATLFCDLFGRNLLVIAAQGPNCAAQAPNKRRTPEYPKLQPS